MQNGVGEQESIQYFVLGTILSLVVFGAITYGATKKRKKTPETHHKAGLTAVKSSGGIDNDQHFKEFIKQKNRLANEVARKKHAHTPLASLKPVKNRGINSDIMHRYHNNERLSQEQSVNRSTAKINPSILNHGNALFDNQKFKNVVLYSGYNTTFTEIDEIIISPFGIFCIEYKEHYGYIFGNPSKEIWTQCKSNNFRRQIYNPLRQNYKHIKALEGLIDAFLKQPIKSYVVFVNAQLVQVDSQNILLGTKELKRELTKYTDRVYSDQECDYMCHLLAKASAKSNGRINEHISDLSRHIGK